MSADQAKVSKLRRRKRPRGGWPEPRNLCAAIAGAILYCNAQGTETRQLQRLRKETRIDALLETICGVAGTSRLGALIKAQLEGIKRRGVYAVNSKAT